MKLRSIPFILLVISLAIGCGKENITSNGPNDNVLPGDFLSGQKYTSLTIEVVYVNGYQPSAEALNNLKTFLQNTINKPSGITITQASIPSPGKSILSFGDIQRIEDSYRLQTTKGTFLTAWIFFADGDYSGNSGNSKVLGIAYGGSSMAIFEKTIKEFSGGVGKPATDDLETTVVSHEFGHILGLTNNGTPMQTPHQDAANGKHCNAQNCLMHFNVETSDVVSNLVGSGIPQLDPACIADLKANGGK